MRQDPTSLRPFAAGKVLTLCIAALLLGACSRSESDAGPAATTKSGAPAPVASLTITTTKVASAQIMRSVPATGSIYAWQEVIVGAEVGGYRVAAVLVDVGSRVQKG